MKKIILTLISYYFIAVAAHTQADNQFAVLVLAIPNKYHYEYIPVARDSMEKLSKLHKFDMTWTHQANSLDGDLNSYAAIIFMNTSGEELNEAQRRNVENYLRKGGNAMIVHRGIITQSGDWLWYEKMVGRSFRIHPMMQTAVVNVVDHSFPATFGVPARWLWTDEWYEFTNPHQIKINPVLKVDESTYDPTRIWPGQTAKGMGEDHPVAWYHTYEKGRVFVTALGHDVEMYKDPNYLNHLFGGLYWTATGKGIQKNSR